MCIRLIDPELSSDSEEDPLLRGGAGVRREGSGENRAITLWKEQRASPWRRRRREEEAMAEGKARRPGVEQGGGCERSGREGEAR